jgi:predicted transcriptional regulator
MLKLSLNNVTQLTTICHALSTPLRVQILQKISSATLSIVELSEALDTSLSTISSNIKVLEDAGLIITELSSATRGTKRMCTKNYADIFINLDNRYPHGDKYKEYEVNMPIGHFSDCNVSPTCGMIGINGLIGSEDLLSSFFDPGRIEAKHIWFRTGFINYRFPYHLNDLNGSILQSIDFSLEICSEAPNYEMEWPSDITFWLNGVELLTWRSPSDFGDRKGNLKSCLWEKVHFSQYGLLLSVKIDSNGTFINEEKVSDTVLSNIPLSAHSLDLKIGIKEDAENKGGVNIFGKGFGDFDQDIKMVFNYIIE